ncbi:host cell division inhibitory peptide Kil [Raoultella ornithinolytica]|uniref:host cell division inhibitory peptide Kil n=1 Tax=Raoultella ornithinolytica TaxID=54291 RepID=UPI0013F430C6|nr:host cell division inhibitory peptide Kil [Raoultella ornithinolytica]QIJ48819.1 host cell division inhibitory peptide Kil [Raoultella ornithinolytica]
MVSFLHSPLIQAAQSKLAIAHFIGDGEMWCQAMASMKGIYDEERHAEDRMFCGRAEELSGLNVRDVVLNYDMYGDLISVDADLLTAKYKINTEVSF